MLRWRLSLLSLCLSCVAVDAEDIDGDGIPNVIDNCIDIKNQNQEDSDDDSIGDLCDNCADISNLDQNDQDSDGVGDVCDNCAGVSNADQRNNDDDSLGDACDNCDDVTNEDQSNNDGDSAGDACDNCLGFNSEDLLDGDGDGIGNPCDCDPLDPEIGPELETIDLGDPESLLPAQGYNFNSWSHNLALKTALQNNLVNNALDSAILGLNQQFQNVYVEVVASSTASTNFDATDDRIVFINARYKDAANATGVGCGIRVDETEAVTQRLQIANLSGTAGSPTITKLANQARNSVNFNETFKLSFKLKGASATCTIVFLQQGNATQTITANNATNQVGAISLLTRETKATYTNAKICQVF